MRFRKKPVVIDAWLWEPTWENLRYMRSLGCDCDVPDKGAEGGDGALVIKTLEGDMRAEVGDMIIRGVKGEFYPCKPDIFRATYEMVE